MKSGSTVMPLTPLVIVPLGLLSLSRRSKIFMCLLFMPQMMSLLWNHFSEWTTSFWANSYKGLFEPEKLVVVKWLWYMLLCGTVPVWAISQTIIECSFLALSKPEASCSNKKISKLKLPVIVNLTRLLSSGLKSSVLHDRETVGVNSLPVNSGYRSFTLASKWFSKIRPLL